MQEDGRLRYLGLLQLLVGSGEHDVRDAETEDLVGFLEQLLGRRYVVVEVFAHAYGLSALTREYVCVLHNFQHFFGSRGQRYEFIFYFCHIKVRKEAGGASAR